MRARIKVILSEEQIDNIKDIELKKIAYMYFIERQSELDIAFTLNYSEKTIQRRIKEIYLQFNKKSV